MKIVFFSVRRMISGFVYPFIIIYGTAASGVTILRCKDVIGATGEYDVVTGYIQEVVNDNIKVEDTYYNIASVPLKTKKGERSASLH